jgi:hypothetical protein
MTPERRKELISAARDKIGAGEDPEPIFQANVTPRERAAIIRSARRFQDQDRATFKGKMALYTRCIIYGGLALVAGLLWNPDELSKAHSSDEILTFGGSGVLLFGILQRWAKGRLVKLFD